MNTSVSEPLEVLPLPAGAIALPSDHSAQGLSAFAVLALQQAMAERRLRLPLGPETALLEAERLLSLNRFALQLVTAGISADQIAVDAALWRKTATAPQLLLAALVDEENDVVWFPGVLTGQEFITAARNAEIDGERLVLGCETFGGGIDRLFTLVQLLEPAALPQLSLDGVQVSTEGSGLVVQVRDWLAGLLDPALVQLGASLQPATATAFRSAAALPAESNKPLAVLAIQLGLDGDGLLVTGAAADHCVERFQLLLAPISRDPASAQVDGLQLALVPHLQGDLLPDALLLQAEQGSHRQERLSDCSSNLLLAFHGPEPILVTIQAPNGATLALPPLQLPAA